MQALSDREKELLTILRAATGPVPTYREIATEMGMSEKSHSAIHRLVVGLERRGIIRRVPGGHRTAEVVGDE